MRIWHHSIIENVQLAIDCAIEHRKITYPFLQLKSDTYGPYLLDFEGWLLPSKPASAPSDSGRFDFGVHQLLGHNASVDYGQVTSRAWRHLTTRAANRKAVQPLGVIVTQLGHADFNEGGLHRCAE